MAAHSLGNMVVSSAIVDYGLAAEVYFMLNAAVAAEAYEASSDNRDAMRHPAWTNYDSRLWASEWYRLFPRDDGRAKLTWRGRFGCVVEAINYYSSTEDVLNNGNGRVPALTIERLWVNQEMRKGTTLLWLAPGNCEAGWGFNPAYDVIVGYDLEGYPIYDRMPAEWANGLPESVLQTNSFFYRFDDKDLYGTNGSVVAQQPALYRQLLADAIPALSNPAGRNSIGAAAGRGNRDMAAFRRGSHITGDWPDPDDRWRHSSVREVAYAFNVALFDAIVLDGGLK